MSASFFVEGIGNDVKGRGVSKKKGCSKHHDADALWRGFSWRRLFRTTHEKSTESGGVTPYDCAEISSFVRHPALSTHRDEGTGLSSKNIKITEQYVERDFFPLFKVNLPVVREGLKFWPCLFVKVS